jgi:hypothetical protein
MYVRVAEEIPLKKRKDFLLIRRAIKNMKGVVRLRFLKKAFELIGRMYRPLAVLIKTGLAKVSPEKRIVYPSSKPSRDEANNAARQNNSATIIETN